MRTWIGKDPRSRPSSVPSGLGGDGDEDQGHHTALDTAGCSEVPSPAALCPLGNGLQPSCSPLALGRRPRP